MIAAKRDIGPGNDCEHDEQEERNHQAGERRLHRAPAPGGIGHEDLVDANGNRCG